MTIPDGKEEIPTTSYEMSKKRSGTLISPYEGGSWNNPELRAHYLEKSGIIPGDNEYSKIKTLYARLKKLRTTVASTTQDGRPETFIRNTEIQQEIELIKLEIREIERKLKEQAEEDEELISELGNPDAKLLYVKSEQLGRQLHSGEKKQYAAAIKRTVESSNVTLKNLVEATNQDPILAALRQSLVDGDRVNVPKDYKKITNELCTEYGVVYRGYKVIIPESLRHWFLQVLHLNHQGPSKMLEEAATIYWPSLNKDIADKVRDCHVCFQAGKNLCTVIPKTDIGALKTLVRPMEEIQIDFAGPYEKFGNRYLLIAVDRFSK